MVMSGNSGRLKGFQRTSGNTRGSHGHSREAGPHGFRGSNDAECSPELSSTMGRDRPPAVFQARTSGRSTVPSRRPGTVNGILAARHSQNPQLVSRKREKRNDNNNDA